MSSPNSNHYYCCTRCRNLYWMNSINSKITNGICPVCGDTLVTVNLVIPQCPNCKEFETGTSEYPCKNCVNGSHWFPEA